jgi:hypothetical protein
MPKLIATERIARAIFVLRGQRVLLDAELAALYGVAPKVLLQSVKRNRKRFPADFMVWFMPRATPRLAGAKTPRPEHHPHQ